MPKKKKKKTKNIFQEAITTKIVILCRPCCFWLSMLFGCVLCLVAGIEAIFFYLIYFISLFIHFFCFRFIAFGLECKVILWC